MKFALFNTGAWSMIPFLDIKESDIQKSVDINIVAATAFAQAVVRNFIAPLQAGSEEKSGGTLIFTGATAATRGAKAFGAFAAGKSGARALSQAIAREYGPQGVHVSYVVVDGTIRTKRKTSSSDYEIVADSSWSDLGTLALFSNREGMEKDWLHDSEQAMTGESIAKTYLCTSLSLLLR